jgi:hypothetical protein
MRHWLSGSDDSKESVAFILEGPRSMNNASSILHGPWMLEYLGNSFLRGVENRLLATRLYVPEDWNPEQFLIIRIRDFLYSISDLILLTTCYSSEIHCTTCHPSEPPMCATNVKLNSVSCPGKITIKSRGNEWQIRVNSDTF